MEPTHISVTGAREHNLRDVSLTLPRGRLICFTGVSGSGKSSFAFDTLFAEGQRRYMESLSSYARQFLGQLAKPDVDHVTGLSPAIAIQQKSSGWNPRSTVGTITQIHDYLRVLFARAGRQHCPICGRPISAQTRDQIVFRLLELPAGTKVIVLAPVIRGQKGEHREVFEDLMRQGYARARVDGQIVALSDAPRLSRYSRHSIEVVIDRLTISAEARARVAEAVEQALNVGEGTMIVQSGDATVRERDGNGGDATVRERAEQHPSVRRPARKRGAGAPSDEPTAMSGGDMIFSSQAACLNCGIGFAPPSPQLFSFNSPDGMCTSCGGLGETFAFDPQLLVPDPGKSFLAGAIEPMHPPKGRWRRHIYEGVAQYVGFDLKRPWRELPAAAKKALLYGLGDTELTFAWRGRHGTWRHKEPFPGVIAELTANYRKANSEMVRRYYEKYMRRGVCEACRGARLNPQALAVRIGGRNIDEVCSMSISTARTFITSVEWSPTEQLIAADAVREIHGRLKFLEDVGLHYLTLSRAAPTLSGGESQRIRLASQIGAGLVGVLYILDEPSIGLHPRDNRKLLESLQRLRDLGNTVIVVEHDEETMRAADHIVDFGPGPGVHGGEVVAQGDLEAVRTAKRSITGRYLSGEEEIEVPKERRAVAAGAKVGQRPRAAGGRKRA